MISAKLERHVSNSLSLAKKNRPCINFLVTNKIQKCLEGMHARAQFAIKISRYFLCVHKFQKSEHMPIDLRIRWPFYWPSFNTWMAGTKLSIKGGFCQAATSYGTIFCYFLHNGFFKPSKWYFRPKIVFKKVGDATSQACLCNYTLRIYEFVMNPPSMKFSLQFQEIGFPCAHLEVVKLFQASVRSLHQNNGLLAIDKMKFSSFPITQNEVKMDKL